MSSGRTIGTEVGSDFGALRGTDADEESGELDDTKLWSEGVVAMATCGQAGFYIMLFCTVSVVLGGAVVLLILWISGVGRQR